MERNVVTIKIIMTMPYHKLIAWQKSHEFFIEVYRVSTKFPPHELFGVTSQLRRAALSSVLNIVEAQARGTAKEYIRFLTISRASLAECGFILECSRDLGYIDGEMCAKLEAIRDEAHRLTNGIITRLRRDVAIKNQKR